MTTYDRAYRLLLLSASAWCALIVLPPVLCALAPDHSAAGIVYAVFARVCHQWDAHSLHLFGFKLAVCARCFAIYAGFWVGVLLAPHVRSAERWHGRTAWGWAVAPMAADVLLGFASWYDPTTASRLLTGGWFGVAAGLLLAPLLAGAIAQYLVPSSAVSSQRNST